MYFTISAYGIQLVSLLSQPTGHSLCGYYRLPRIETRHETYHRTGTTAPGERQSILETVLVNRQRKDLADDQEG
jgi:hypothetical protein